MTYKKLKQSQPIHNLAHALGIRLSANPVDEILKLCDEKIEKIMAQMPNCNSFDEMLEWVANKVGTIFEIIGGDDDLLKIKRKYLQKQEYGFLNLEVLFLDENDLGVTIKLMNYEEWEPQFVSVIDSRGNKTARAYFTKWHEIAHILTMPENAQTFSFSHASASSGEPVERLMDLVAGRFGFHSAIAHQHISEEISFESIESLRQKICPQSSFQAAMINLTKFWTTPCILVGAKPALKKGEEAKLIQGSFFFYDEPQPELRAVHVTLSDISREYKDFNIFKNMRIPTDSIISKIYSNGDKFSQAFENLSWWESQGKHLPDYPIKVQAKRFGDLVNALITIN